MNLTRIKTKPSALFYRNVHDEAFNGTDEAMLYALYFYGRFVHKLDTQFPAALNS